MKKFHLPSFHMHLKKPDLTYRTRRRLKTCGIAVLLLVLVAAISWMVWLLWLDRFVVYSREGATLDYNRSNQDIHGSVAVPPEKTDSVNIYYNDGSDALDVSTELGIINGYYADANALSSDFETVKQQIENLPDGSAIMLDVKNDSGYFYYTTKVGKTSTEVNPASMDALIDYIRHRSLYLIARIPALKDYDFGLNHVPSGLFLPSGIGLWMDDDGCYWLNPGDSVTLNYLIQIINELKAMGFREVVLDDFQFPISDGYTYEGDKQAILTETAATLVSSCSNNSFTVSFAAELGSFTLPKGRMRLYLSNASAVNVEQIATESGVADPTINLVFMTAAKDTRFDSYSVMRPIASAHFDGAAQKPNP